MASDGTAAAFLTIDYQVISLCPDFGWIRIQVVQIFRQWHGKGVVFRHISLLFGVPMQQWEPNDPGIVIGGWVVQLEFGSETNPEV